MNDKFDELAKGLNQSVTRRGMLRKFRPGLAGIALALLGLLLNSTLGFGQGALASSGPTGPTIKPPTQIEQRTPISSAPFTISTPGSYYLTTNLTVAAGDAVTIGVDNVTLDLNGFTISSAANPASGTGVLLSGRRTIIAVLNGFISGGVTNNAGVYTGSGFADGITYSSSAPANVRVTGVSVSGCLNGGISLGSDNNSVVESCVVTTVGGGGIAASSVTHCTATGCGATAISASTASDCYGSSSGSYGLTALNANNCTGHGAPRV